MTQTVKTLKRSNQLKNCIDAHSSSQTQSILLSCEPCEPEMTAAEPRHQRHQRNQRYQRHLLGIPMRCELVNWACALCALRALSDRVSSAWKDFFTRISGRISGENVPIRGKLLSKSMALSVCADLGAQRNCQTFEPWNRLESTDINRYEKSIRDLFFMRRRLASTRQRRKALVLCNLRSIEVTRVLQDHQVKLI